MSRLASAAVLRGGRLARVRGGRRLRLLAGPLAAAALLALITAAPARAGTFRVHQCAAADAGVYSPRAYQGDLWWVGGGWPDMECGAPGGRLRIDVAQHRLPAYGGVDAHLTVPGSMPATTIRTAWLDWTSMPQAPSTNPGYLALFAGQARLIEGAPSGSGTRPGEAQRFSVPGNARSLVLTTWCSPLNGPGWCNWPGHLFEVRALTLELEESVEPGAEVGGPLVGGGERGGVEPLEVRASDGDSGVRRVAVSLGGAPVGTLQPAHGCRDDHLPACPKSLRGTVDVDTRAVADGTHRLRVVVTDAADNTRTLDPAAVTVRNRRADPVPAPPAQGTAPAAPVPVAATPPRQDPFPPNPLAGRGHVANGTNASERATLRAWLEPGGGRRTSATTVPAGVRVRIRGTLTDPRDRPIGRATLAAIRREPGGAWKPVTGVRTRPNGRFTAFTRIGPSQEVRFVYYAYGDSVRGRAGRTLRVRVRRE